VRSGSPGKNGHADGFTVVGVTLEWSGVKFKLDDSTVVKAFYDADIGEVLGDNARWFLELDGEMKSLEEVLVKIVPFERDEISLNILELFASTVESLGFSVLDRREHHLL